MHTIAFRLRPGQDPARELRRLVDERKIRAGLILTCVGSLRRAALRLADKDEASYYEDKFEIVALVGTLSPDGNHLHLALADGSGRTIGGHLLEGCEVYTTAEIVVGVLENVAFSRPLDAETGYDELLVRDEGEPRFRV
jgi:uncharacterized protein